MAAQPLEEYRTAEGSLDFEVQDDGPGMTEDQVAQSAACASLHLLEQRCCRSLLMTRDRMHSDEFPLTQEFLAMMLGVRRAGVTVAAGGLQRAGLIRYTRGNVTIIDRHGLEQRSCECYGVSKKEFDRLLGAE